MPEFSSGSSDPAELSYDITSSHPAHVKPYVLDVNVDYVRFLRDRGGMTAQTIGEALLDLKRRSGLSLNAIAQAAGYSGPSSVQAFFHPNYDPPALDIAVAHKLITAFERRGSPPIAATDLFQLTGAYGERKMKAEPSTKTVEYLGISEGDLPFYAVKPQSEIIFGDKKRPLQTIACNFTRPSVRSNRPGGLAKARTAFGLFIADSSMAPKYAEGDPVFLSEARQPVKGDDALLVLQSSGDPAERGDGFEVAVLGQLLSRTVDQILIKQHRRPLPAWIGQDQVARIYRVYRWSEVCGLFYA